jgi:hypothetical protein
MQHTKPEMGSDDEDEGSIYSDEDSEDSDSDDDSNPNPKETFDDSDVDPNPNRVFENTLVDHHWIPFFNSMKDGAKINDTVVIAQLNEVARSYPDATIVQFTHTLTELFKKWDEGVEGVEVGGYVQEDNGGGGSEEDNGGGGSEENNGGYGNVYDGDDGGYGGDDDDDDGGDDDESVADGNADNDDNVREEDDKLVYRLCFVYKSHAKPQVAITLLEKVHDFLDEAKEEEKNSKEKLHGRIQEIEKNEEQEQGRLYALAARNCTSMKIGYTTQFLDALIHRLVYALYLHNMHINTSTICYKAITLTQHKKIS